MQLGSSKPWQEVLEKITGETKMSASGLLEYFKPLHEWLKADNEKNKETIGWSKTQKGQSFQFFNTIFKIIFKIKLLF